MNPKKRKPGEWRLTRERFHISSPFPPRPVRQEKTIGTILSEMHGEKSETNPLPSALKERWAIIAGEQIAAHTAPAYLRGTQLIIYADHPGWLTEIRRLPKKKLLKKISTISNMPEIKDVRFQLDPAIQTKRW